MPYNKTNDYCSMSPDGIFGVRFNYACFLHDQHYRNEVKNRKTRLKADKDFRNYIIYIYKNNQSPFHIFNWNFKKWYLKPLNIFSIFNFKSKSKILIKFRNKFLSQLVGWIYYFGVRIGGKRAWKNVSK